MGFSLLFLVIEKTFQQKYNGGIERFNVFRGDSLESISLLEQRHNFLVDQMQQGHAVHEVICDEKGNVIDFRFVSVNTSYEMITGLKWEDLIGSTLLEVRPDTERHLIEAYSKVALKGEPYQYDKYSVEQDKYFSVYSYSPKHRQFAVIITDITEKIRMEKLIRENELRYRRVVELTSDIAYSCKRDGESRYTINWINGAAEEITGYSNDEIKDKGCWRFFVVEEDNKIFEENIIQLEAGMESFCELRIRHKKGNIIWISSFAECISEKEYLGAPVLYGSIKDITQNKLLKEELVKSESNYRFLIENSHDIIYQLDDKGVFLFASPSLTRIMGYTAEMLVGESIQEIVHPEDISMCKNILQKAIVAGERQEGTEYRVRHLDGSWRWHTSNVTPYSDETGKIIGVVGIARDINERKENERNQKERENYLRVILETTQDGFWIADFQGNILDINEAYCNMSGYTRRELLKMRLVDLEVKESSREIAEHMKSVSENGSDTFESRHQKKDGTIMDVEISVACLNHEPLTILAFCRDITRRKQYEKNLIEQNTLLEGVINAIPDVLAIQHPDHRVERYNRAGYELMNLTQDEVRNKKCYELIGRSAECEQCATSLALKTKKLETIEKYIPEMGVYLDCRSNPILDENGDILYIVEQLRDITDKKNVQARIEYLSFHDQLTGLYNRRFYEEELKRLDTMRNLPLTLAILDVNGLKLSNDAFGHSYGDDVLRKVSQVLKGECREDDIVARIGGDEFIILLPNTSSEQASLIIDRIRTSINSEKINSINLSVSFGWETKISKEEEIHRIFKKAEDYMYRNKLSESDSIRHETIRVVMKTLYEKNDREEKHSKRVSEYCEKMGIAFGLGKEDVKELKIVGLMHDIGKITINDDILNKPIMLSDSEWSSIKRHPEIGYRILSSVNEYSNLADFVLAHHERWDGKGYPRGLKGEEIPLQSRIIAVIDAYDAMTGYRPYRKSLDKKAAVKEIVKNAGTQFDSELVKIFVEQVL
ncbi:MAG: PAS domain S-box protein [Peptococcaceae bacterium]|nr:PAS domain S-box protein [Peptococcaceae bacterium]